MSVKAQAQVTLSKTVDVASVTRYYLLQSSTLSAPAKPTDNPPTGWITTEPSYSEGATTSLYTCELTLLSDASWSYSDVSLSSSYEAAKDAYNKAVAAAKTATDYIDFGADGLIVGDMTDGALSGNVRIASDGIELRDGTSVLTRLKAGLLELAANSVNAIIKLCGGKGIIAYYAGTNQLAIMSPGSIAVTACQTLPDGTIQPWDAGVACNRYGVLAKGAVEVSGSLKVNGVSWESMSPIASQTWPDTYVTGRSYGKLVTINVDYSAGTAYTTTQDSVVGTVKAGFWPPRDTYVLCGIQGGAWLYMIVRTNGNIVLTHRWQEAGLTWGEIHASVSYVAI